MYDTDLSELLGSNEGLTCKLEEYRQINELLTKEIHLRDEEMKGLKEQCAWQMGEIVRLRRMVEAALNG